MSATNLKSLSPASISRTCALALMMLMPLPALAEGLVDGEGQAYDLRALRGQVVAVTFGSASTQEEVGRINQLLDAQVRPGDVQVVSVVDLGGVPGWLHGYARGQVAKNQRGMRIKLVLDEAGSLRRPLGVQPTQRVDILVIDRQGAVRGRFRGEGELTQVLHLLAELRQAAGPAVALADRR